MTTHKQHREVILYLDNLVITTQKILGCSYVEALTNVSIDACRLLEANYDDYFTGRQEILDIVSDWIESRENSE